MKTQARGFTLIELMFTLAVAAVLSTLAAPSMQRFVARHHATGAYYEVVSALKLARGIAVSRSTTSIMCPSVDLRHCAPSQHWQRGWLVATDRNRDYQPDGAPAQVFSIHADDIRVWSSRGRQRIRFHANGSAPGSNLSLVICHEGEPQGATSVVVSNVGRVRHGKPAAARAAACAAS